MEILCKIVIWDKCWELETPSHAIATQINAFKVWKGHLFVRHSPPPFSLFVAQDNFRYSSHSILFHSFSTFDQGTSAIKFTIHVFVKDMGNLLITLIIGVREILVPQKFPWKSCQVWSNTLVWGYLYTFVFSFKLSQSPYLATQGTQVKDIQTKDSQLHHLWLSSCPRTLQLSWHWFGLVLKWVDAVLRYLHDLF